METLVDRLKESPAFQSMATRALEIDRAEQDSRREAAAREIAEDNSRWEAWLADYRARRNPILAEIGSLEHDLAEARKRDRALQGEYLRKHADREAFITGRRGVLLHSIPAELQQVISDLTDLQLAVASKPLTIWHEAVSVISRLTGRQKTVTHSDAPQRAQWQAAIIAAREAANKLTESFTPAEELRQRVADLRATVPGEAWRLLEPYRRAHYFTPTTR